MNDFITKNFKFKGAVLTTAGNSDFTVDSNLVAVLIKPYTGSTISVATVIVKTADASADLGAASTNVPVAYQIYTNAKRNIRITGAATVQTKVGNVLVFYRDRITPDNAVNSYVA